MLGETAKAMTPFGGLSGFFAFLARIGFGARMMPAMPFPAPTTTSPDGIPLAPTFTAFLYAVATGTGRFAHADRLHGDLAVARELGAQAVSRENTVWKFFRRVTQRLLLQKL